MKILPSINCLQVSKYIFNDYINKLKNIFKKNNAERGKLKHEQNIISWKKLN
jgi:hypothetical protein